MIVICSYSRNDNNDNDNFQLVKSNLDKEEHKGTRTDRTRSLRYQSKHKKRNFKSMHALVLFIYIQTP